MGRGKNRPGRALLAGGHRDAALLQPRLPLGVPRVRGRRRRLRALAAGGGRPADGGAGRAQGGAAGEEGEEGGEGRCRCREERRLNCSELRVGRGRTGGEEWMKRIVKTRRRGTNRGYTHRDGGKSEGNGKETMSSNVDGSRGSRRCVYMRDYY